MNKIDLCVTMNMKMVVGNCIAMCMGSFLLAMLNLYSGFYVSLSTKLIYYTVILIALIVIPLLGALKKIMYSSMFGNSAYLYNSLPLEITIQNDGKIVSAGVCLCLGMLSAVWSTANMLIETGDMLKMRELLILRGWLPSEVALPYAIAVMTSIIFMFALAAVILLTVVYGRGVKKMGKLATGIMAAGASFTAAAVVSLPWIVKIMEDGANITVMTPFASLLLTIAILIAAGYGAQNLAERGDIYEG